MGNDLLMNEIAMSQVAVEEALEKTLGYDARCCNDFAEHWPEERRNDFLYRTDVRKVLSVDTTVWPSIFADLPEPLPAHLESLAPCGLWAEERALRKAVSQRAESGPEPAVQTIKVTLAWDGAETPHPASGELGHIVEAPSQGGEWQFVGFSELSAPSAFRRFSDIRLASDHAPTFVYGIHILKPKQGAATDTGRTILV